MNNPVKLRGYGKKSHFYDPNSVSWLSVSIAASISVQSSEVTKNKLDNEHMELWGSILEHKSLLRYIWQMR